MSWQDTSIYDTAKRLFVELVGLCTARAKNAPPFKGGALRLEAVSRFTRQTIRPFQ